MDQKDFQALVNKYKEEMMQIFNTVRKDKNIEINYTDNSKNKSTEHNLDYNNLEDNKESYDIDSTTLTESKKEYDPTSKEAEEIDNITLDYDKKENE